MIKAIILSAAFSCLSEAMYAEARGDGYHGMIAVGAVIHNRVLDERWPNSFCDVIEQPNQFSYLPLGKDAGAYINMLDEPEAKEKAERAAYAILTSREEPLLENILYYHRDDVTPDWDFNILVEISRYNRHVFYGDS